MGFSCKSKSAIAVRICVQEAGRSNGGSLERFEFRELEAATGGFARESRVARASHGEVYRAALRDGRVVAVKRGADTSDAFSNEAQILSKLFSRRLVNLLGCSYDARASLLLVLEHMERGTLHATLQAKSQALTWPTRLNLALDVAKAIRALHASSPPIVHHNIHSSNIFLDHHGHARLADFCLAKRLEPNTLISHLHPSDPRKTDVFSFGVVFLEILSGRSADHDALLDWALPLIKHGHSMAICDPRITPFPDTAAVRLVASVAARCVRSSSARRPSMDEVVQSLTKATKLTTNLTQTPTLPKQRLIDVRSPTVKKRRAVVFRLTRFLARKFRIGARRSSSYDKLSVLKGAKVVDEGRSKSGDHKSCRHVGFPGSSSHCSGTKFVRL